MAGAGPADFLDRVALVTGATSGIGTACARELASPFVEEEAEVLGDALGEHG